MKQKYQYINIYLSLQTTAHVQSQEDISNLFLSTDWKLGSSDKTLRYKR
jgi:hypothetical protein